MTDNYINILIHRTQRDVTLKVTFQYFARSAVVYKNCMELNFCLTDLMALISFHMKLS